MALAGPSRHALRSLLSCRQRPASLAVGLSRTFPLPFSPSPALPSPFAALRAFSTTTPTRLPRTPPRADEPVSWVRKLQERGMEQEAREMERERLDSTWNKYGRREPIRSFWRPIVFTLGFSYVAFVAAAFWTNMDAAKWMDKPGMRRFGRQPSDDQMKNAKRLEEAKAAQATLKTLPSVLAFLPNMVLVPVMRTYIMYKEAQINSPTARRAQVELLGILAGVFVCWRLKAFQPLMTKWFLHNPVAWTKRQDWRNSFTMLTSTFSHRDVAHLAFNSIALFSFGSAAYYYLATPVPGQPVLPTTTHVAHYFAFFATAGVFAGLGSHLASNLVRLPRLIRALRSPAQLSPTHALAAHHALYPSLGASGAVYACLTMTALAYPDANISLIFLPMLAIPMPVGVLGMVAVDLFGIIRGWRQFDHFAHLAGALFGAFYYFEGKAIWNWFRLHCGGKPRATGFMPF